MLRVLKRSNWAAILTGSLLLIFVCFNSQAFGTSIVGDTMDISVYFPDRNTLALSTSLAVPGSADTGLGSGSSRHNG
jgi:hypothetical protein